MQLFLLILTLCTTTFLFGCASKPSQKLSKNSPSEISQKVIPIPLKSAIEELRVIKIKLDEPGRLVLKEYGENITDVTNIVNKAYGDPEALSAVKSALKGHQLAVQFWQCDRLEGYDDLHQCRDKALKPVFAKYPDIEAQAKAAVAGEKSTFISAGLDKDALLQAIWAHTGADTDVAVQATALPPPPKEGQE
jgi:hypothetical protein